MRGVCIQLGLRDVAEYYYLVDATAPADPLKRIPDLGVDTWDFYGVDADAWSIAHMMERYDRHRPRVKWVNAYIMSGPPKLTVIHSLIQGTRFRGMTLSFDAMLDFLGIERIDVLAVDIEGGEEDLFNSYSWRYKPRFIAVEIHVCKYQHEYLIDGIKSRGYEQTLRKPTNKGRTIEYQFTLIGKDNV